MNYDDILKELGGFGKWQILTSILCGICQLLGGVVVLIYSFAGKQKITRINYNFSWMVW